MVDDHSMDLVAAPEVEDDMGEGEGMAEEQAAHLHSHTHPCFAAEDHLDCARLDGCLQYYLSSGVWHVVAAAAGAQQMDLS